MRNTNFSTLFFLHGVTRNSNRASKILE